MNCLLLFYYHISFYILSIEKPFRLYWKRLFIIISWLFSRLTTVGIPIVITFTIWLYNLLFLEGKSFYLNFVVEFLFCLFSCILRFSVFLSLQVFSSFCNLQLHCKWIHSMKAGTNFYEFSLTSCCLISKCVWDLLRGNVTLL